MKSTSRISAAAVLGGATACAAAALALTAPGAMAAPPASAPPDGPSLRKATLDEGVLSLSAQCDGRAIATVRRGARSLGTVRINCSSPAAARLRLPAKVAALADGERGLSLDVRLRDRSGTASVPVTFARPLKQRSSSSPRARAAGVTFWNGPTDLCARYGGINFQNTYVNSATFGYRWGTPLWIGVYTNVWSSQLGHQWLWRGWQRYNAGSAYSPNIDGSFTQRYPGVYSRSQLVVYGGAAHFVRVGIADSKWTGADGAQWCYWA